MSHNTLVHLAIRPVIRLVAKSPLRPNHLTYARITTAACAVVGFATGSAQGLYFGCAMFTCSALLDRADGELARQTERFSSFGHWLDLLSDCAADALAFMALGVGAWPGPLGAWAPILGCMAGSGVMALFWQLNSGGGRPMAPPRLVDPDDVIFVVPVLVLCCGMEPTLLLAGTVTPAIAAYAVCRGLKL